MMSTAGILQELVSTRRKCGMAIHLRNKVSKNKHMVIGALCGSWKCPTCGAFLRQKWTAHLCNKLSSAGTVYVSIVGKSRWNTISKRIARAGGQFATVEQADGILMVFTTVAEGEMVSGDTMLDLLMKSIKEAILEHRPVHTSRGWGLPKTLPRMSEDRKSVV